VNCSEGCGRQAFSQGMCRACYMRQRRAAGLEPARRDWVADKHHYPFSALEAFIPDMPTSADDREQGRNYWQDRLGAVPQQVTKWRKRGLSWRTADTLACRLGVHPGLVWPDWFERGFMDGRMDGPSAQEESAA
jgi:hypothetical protein